MAPRETENNAYAKFGVTNKEHYGLLWYFLEWSILHNLCFSFLLDITAVQIEKLKTMLRENFGGN